MINFTVGPVQSSDSVLAIGAEQVPYFRTEEFSKIMLENEKLVKEFAHTSDESRVVFITGSGTASMEATIMNTLTTNDKALVVNGGSFGQRFVDLCKLHNINFDEIKLEIGQNLTEDILKKYDNQKYTAFIVNIHETSTGVHYDVDLISQFCKKNNLFLVVDAISSFLADEINMEEKSAYIEQYVREHKQLSFRELLQKQNSKMEMIVTFLVILELMKSGKIVISQENIFDDIIIESMV